MGKVVVTVVDDVWTVVVGLVVVVVVVDVVGTVVDVVVEGFVEGASGVVGVIEVVEGFSVTIVAARQWCKQFNDAIRKNPKYFDTKDIQAKCAFIF